MQMRQRGFTLIEMAIVLVIVGLILATTLPLVTERIARDKATKGAQYVNTLKQEIIGYAMIEGHLPTTNYVATNFSGAQDAWGQNVNYYPADGLTAAPGGGDLLSSAASPSALSLRRTTSSGSDDYDNIAFILVSRGPNQNLEVDATTNLTADAATDPLTTQVEYSGYPIFYSRGGYVSAAGESYDDIVEYVSFPYLTAKVDAGTGSGTSPNNFVSGTDEGIASVLTSGQSLPNASTQGANNPIILNEATNELELGSVDEATGCTWYADTNATIPCEDIGSGVIACTPVAASRYWKSLHFVMRFNFLHKDYYTRAAENRYAGGWTFAVISAIPTQNSDTTAPCGSGVTTGAGYLGYANYGSGHNYWIDDPKFGVEVDAFKDLGQSSTVDRNDADQNRANTSSPWVLADELNHISPVFWEFNLSNTANAGSHNDDNLHGHSSAIAGNTNSVPLFDSGAATNATHNMIAGLADANATMWLEDGEDHWIRIELVRTTDDTVVNAGNSVSYTTHIWIDDTPNATFLDLAPSMVGTAAANYEQYTSKTVTFDLSGVWGGSNINTMMNRFRFGWTTATGSVAGRNNQLVNTANIGQFGWNYTLFP